MLILYLEKPNQVQLIIIFQVDLIVTIRVKKIQIRFRLSKSLV